MNWRIESTRLCPILDNRRHLSRGLLVPMWSVASCPCWLAAATFVLMSVRGRIHQENSAPTSDVLSLSRALPQLNPETGRLVLFEVPTLVQAPARLAPNTDEPLYGSAPYARQPSRRSEPGRAKRKGGPLTSQRLASTRGRSGTKPCPFLNLPEHSVGEDLNCP